MGAARFRGPQPLGHAHADDRPVQHQRVGVLDQQHAGILGPSTRTVEKYLAGIYAKLGVLNRAAAAALVLTLLGRAAS